MHPILIQLGPLYVDSYTAAIALGFFAAFVYTGREFDRRGFDRVRTSQLQLLILVAGMAGSHWLHALLHWREYVNQPLAALAFWMPVGRVYLGGFLGATAVALAYCRYARLPMAICADIAAPSVALAQSIGRLGCFLAGCCYGAPSGLPWCVTFPTPSGQPAITVHPTQLYESAATLLLFLGLHRYLGRKDRPAGDVLAAYAFFYGIIRFAVELFRGDSRGAWVLGAFSPSQWIALILMLAAAVAHRRLVARARATAP